jgi:hypothetical protein
VDLLIENSGENKSLKGKTCSPSINLLLTKQEKEMAMMMFFFLLPGFGGQKMRKEGVATVWSSPGRRDGWSLDGGKLILTRTRRSPVAAEINAGRRPVPHSTNKKFQSNLN